MIPTTNTAATPALPPAATAASEQTVPLAAARAQAQPPGFGVALDVWLHPAPALDELPQADTETDTEAAPATPSADSAPAGDTASAVAGPQTVLPLLAALQPALLTPATASDAHAGALQGGGEPQPANPLPLGIRPLAAGTAALPVLAAPSLPTPNPQPGAAAAPALLDGGQGTAAAEHSAPQALASQPLTLPIAASAATPVVQAEWAPLKLAPAAPSQWAQPLQQALGERVSVQLGHGIENAVIRLDPPMLGSLEIAIRHQAGALQVQLTASHGEVVRQLQGISDNLRQDLANRQYADVSVTVSDGRGQGADTDAQGRAQREAAQQQQAKPGRALAEAEQGYAGSAFTLAQHG